ncbi:MAG TPA: Flp pilus assembly protein CpaB [Candidatus Dormibacteraeota bacterium]|jgi:Flp pilus assembly protein CpaB
MVSAEPQARRINVPVIGIGAVIAVLGFAITVVLARSTAPPGGATGSQAVVVASRDLEQRTTLQAGDLTVAHWTPADVPPGALAKPEAATGQVLLASLKQGQPVLANQVGKATDVTGQQPAFLPLAPGFVAATLPSAELPGVGGYVQPGDYIDIVAIVASRTGGTANVRTIYSGVRVIRVGPAGSTAAAGPASSLTLAVSECQAEYLNWFVANAGLKFTLLAHDDYAAAAAAPADTSCPAGGSAKGVTESDIRARWPGLLG